MFSEYDKTGIKSKILHQITCNFNFSHHEQLGASQLHERVSSTKKELHTSPHEDLKSTNTI